MPAPVLSAIQRFIRGESAGGFALVGATLVALLAANGPWSAAYRALLAWPVGVAMAGQGFSRPVLFWVNDALMAVFFYLVGLELKRERLEGELREPRRALLPLFGAVGGMALPALAYLAVAGSDALFRQGWAIPTATDIAFALGVLTLLGAGVPHGLKVFLVSLAIIDDIGAVLIIVVCYSHGLSLPWLAAAGACLGGLWLLGRAGIGHWLAHLPLVLCLWVATLNSGVHATLAGVAAAFCMPLLAKDGSSPLKRLEAWLHAPVAFGVLPLFAFCNAGVPLAGLTLASLAEPVPLGVSMGLLLGKQIGVLSAAMLAVRLGVARLPEGVRWRDIHGVAVLCGIGFTMSLFVSGLAFDGHGEHLAATSRLGILLGSTLSAVAGGLLLARRRST